MSIDRFWDGGNGGLYDNSVVNGGTGTWTASPTDLAWPPRHGHQFGAVIQGSGGIEKTDLGALTLTAPNTYAGGTMVLDGILNVTGPAISAPGVVSAGLMPNVNLFLQSSVPHQVNLVKAAALLAAGPNLYWDGGNEDLYGNNNVDGGTGIWADVGSSKAWTDAGGSENFKWTRDSIAVFTGMPGTVTVNSQQGNGVDIGGAVFLVNGYVIAGDVVRTTTPATMLHVDAGVGATMSVAIAETGGIEKTGSGFLTLTGASSYSGLTAVTEGTLLINGNQTLARGAVSVASGATLGGTGTTGGVVTVADAGHLLGVQGQIFTMDTLVLNPSSLIHVSLAAPSTTGLFNINGNGGGTGNLTLDGILNITAIGPFGPGVYRLMDYTGALTDNGLTFGTVPEDLLLTVQTSVPNQVNLINGGAAFRFWDGDTLALHDNGQVNGGNGIWLASPTNQSWTNGAATVNGPWQQDSFAIFQAIPGTVTVDNAAGDVTLRGAQFAVNGYTIVGQPLTTTTMTASTIIRVGDGTAAGAAMIATIESVIQGSGGLEKTDLGTLVLTGANAYTGGTTISSGTLQLGSGGTTGTVVGNIVNNGALRFNRSDNVTFSGVISGTGSLTQQGPGTLMLTNSNTYTGGTTIAAGTLQVGNGGTTGSVVGNIVDNGTLRFNRSDVVTFGGVISGTGSLTQQGPGVLILTGSNTYTGGTTISAGALQLGNGGATGSVVGNIVDDGALRFNRSDDVTFGGVISGTGSLTQQGPGALILSGISTYSGATMVSAGTLLVNGALEGTATTVASGATLGGFGSIAGPVTITTGGHLAPGLGPGTLTTGTLTLTPGAILDWALNTPGVAGGPTNDLTVVNGDLALDGTLNVTTAGGPLPPGVYRLINYTGALADNGLDVGSLPPGGVPGIDLFVQTSVPNQINLINSFGLALTYWDGGAAALHDNGAVNGGSGIWDNTANRNWTQVDGAVNGRWSANGVATFMGTGGTVTVSNANGGVTFSGATFLSNGYTIAGESLTTTTAATPISVGAGLTATISAPLVGTGGIDKVGAGTLTLSGADSYSGATMVSGGTMLVNGSLGGTVTTVASGATLGGTGSVAGPVTINDGGHLAPGEGPGTLNTGPLTLTSGAILDYALNTPGVVGGATNDLTIVNGDLTLDGMLNVTTASGPLATGIYRLINYTGTLANNGLDVVAPGVIPGIDVFVQTRVPNQVNLINSFGLPLTYWDGDDTAFHDDGTVNGGNGVWDNTANRNWTLASGLINGRWAANSVATFTGTGGTVTVSNGNGLVTFSGATFFSNGYTITGGQLTTTTSPTTIAVAPGAAATIAAPIVGSGGIDKVDAGTLTLSGANAYSGLTTVTAGTLRIDGNQTLATGAISVAPNAILAGTGTTGGNVTIAGGAHLVGVQGQTFTMNGLTLNSTSQVDVSLAIPESIALFKMDGNGGGPGNLALDGVLNIAVTGLFGPGVYRLMDYTGTLMNNGLDFGPLAPGAIPGIDFFVQTSVANEVNLINSFGVELRFWDGGNPALHDNGQVNGGTGLWDNIANRNWTEPNGALNGRWSHDQIAIFQGPAGTVTVSTAGGPVHFSGAQFTTDGYAIIGDTLTTTTAHTSINVGTGLTTTISAPIVGSGGIDKVAGGTLTLSGANTYTGATTVTAGTLLINGDQTQATGPVSVGFGATLGGTGATGGTVTVADGGHLRGVQGQTFTITALTLNPASQIDVSLTAPGSIRLFNIKGNGGVPGNLVLDGVLNITAPGSVSPGVYRLMDYTGTLADSGLDFGSLPAGAIPGIDFFVQTSVANQVNLINSFGLALTYWDGGSAPLHDNGEVNGGSGIWDNTANRNWTLSDGTINGRWAANSVATFTGTSGTVTVSNAHGGVTFSGATFLANDYTIAGDPLTTTSAATSISVDTGLTATISAPIAGTGGIDKAGAGTLVLTGSNTYAGGTTIAAGTLQLGNGGAGGSILGDVVNNGTLAFNRADPHTFAGAISGSGGLLVLGPGPTTLTGANTYSGVSVIGVGNTLQIGDGGATGTLGAGAVQLAGTLAFNRSGSTTAPGDISGAGRLIQQGPGVTILTGTNTYTGGTTIESGTLQIGNGGTTGSVAGDIVDNGMLRFNRSNDVTFAGVISGTGSLTQQGPGALILTNSNTYTGGTTIAAGTLSLGNGGTTGSVLGYIVDNGLLVFNRADDVTFTQLILGTGAVTKLGGGTTALMANNSYTGVTNVTSGTLLINGNQTAATGAVLVAPGATLAGTGITGGNVSVATGGHLVGLQGRTFTMNALSLASGAQVDVGLAVPSPVGLFDINGNGGGPAAGNVHLAGQMNVSALPPFGPGVYRVMSYTGSLTDAGMTLGVVPPGLTPNVDLKIETAALGRVNLLRLVPDTPGTIWDGANSALFDNHRVDGGSGTWTSLPANRSWTNETGAVNGAWQTHGFAIFQATPGTVTVDTTAGELLFGGLQFAVNGYTITGSPLTTTTANTVLRAGDATLEGAGFTGTIAAVIQGSGGVEKTDLGTLVLAGQNTYTGGTTISHGTLQLGAGGATGSVLGDILDNSALVFDRSNTYLFGGVVSGTGSVTQAGTGTTIFTSNHLYTGGTTITAGTLQLGNGGTSGMVPGDIVDNAALVFNRSDVVTYGGVITGTGSVTQAGPGTLIFTGDHSYAGGTVISSGTLQLGNGGVTGSLVGDVLDNGAFVFNRSNILTFGGTIGGTGMVAQIGLGTTILTQPSSYSGGTSITAGTLVARDVAALGTGAVLLGQALLDGLDADHAALRLDIDDAHSGTLANRLSGSGLLTKALDGSVVLTAADSVVGRVSVDAGQLVFAQEGPFRTNNGGFTIGSGAGAAVMAPASLVVDAAFTIADAGTLTLELGPAGSDPKVTAASADLGPDTTLNVIGYAPGSAARASQLPATSRTVIHTTGGINGDFAHVNIATTGQPDYLSVGGGKDPTGRDYNLGLRMRWYEELPLSHGTFTLGTGGAFDVDVPLVNVAANPAAQWDGQTLTKLGPGTLTLSSPNTYTGLTGIGDGMLALAGAGSVAASSGVLLAAPGTTLSIASADGGRTIQDLFGVPGSAVVLGANTLTAGTNRTTVFEGSMTGSGGFIKQGAGSIVFNDVSSYAGATEVREGAMIVGDVDHRDAGLSGGGLVTVRPGAVFGGYGYVTGDVVNEGRPAGVAGAMPSTPGVVLVGGTGPGTQSAQERPAVLEIQRTLTNAGVVAISPAIAGDSLIVGSYAGRNGVISLRTVLGDDRAPTDRLVIDGGRGSGMTSLLFNVEGNGALTTGDGIPVVVAERGATTDPGAFTAEGPISTPLYDYALHRGGLGPSNPESWFLRSTYRSELSLYTARVPFADLYGQALLDTLHERAGDQERLRGRADLRDQRWVNGAWGRILGRHGDWNGGGMTADGPPLDYDLWAVQGGLDLIRHENDNGSRVHGGIHGSSGTIRGAVTSDAGSNAGDVTLDLRTLGGYWTHFGGRGWYLDGLAQFSWIDGTMTAPRVNVRPQGTSFGTSVEGGYPFALGKEMILEPQAQLVFQRVGFDSIEDPIAPVRFDDTTSFVGRFGGRFSRAWRTRTPSPITTWARLDLFHQFKGEIATGVAVQNQLTPLSYDFTDRWMAFGLGGDLPFGRLFSVYGSFTYSFGVAGSDRSAVGGKGGLRLNW